MEGKKRNNSYDTGIAAEYFVLSQLYRKNVEAYISQGNKKAIDIRIIKKNSLTVSVDVKAIRGYASLALYLLLSRIGLRFSGVGKFYYYL